RSGWRPASSVSFGSMPIVSACGSLHRVPRLGCRSPSVSREQPLGRELKAGSQRPDWRPETYWPPLPSDADLVGRVRGARRREALREALATGDFSNVDPGVVREALDVEERRAVMGIHPHPPEGEYLPELEDPDLREGEVEIPRLYLA